MRELEQENIVLARLIAFFGNPIPYLVLLTLIAIRIVVDPRSATLNTFFSVVGVLFGLLAATTVWRSRPHTAPPDGESHLLSGPAQFAAVAAGVVLGLPAAYMVGPVGSIVGALTTAAVASAIPSITGRGRPPSLAASAWIETLVLALIVCAALLVAALTLPRVPWT